MGMSRWQRWKQTTIANKWLVLTGVIVASGTLAQVGIAFFSYRMFVAGSKETGTQIGRIIEAADRIATSAKTSNQQQLTAITESGRQNKATLDSAAKLALQQLETQRQEMQQDQRPWVGLQSVSCQQCSTDAGGSFKVGAVVVVLANTGKTPATQMTIEAATSTRRTTDPIPDLQPNPGQLATHEVLAPNATRPIDIEKGLFFERQPFRIEDLQRVPPVVRRDGGVVYLVGRITYRGGNPAEEYVTRFCLVNIRGTDLTYCQTGNEMR